jgi:methylase of polypeptide subunit release factors
MQFKAATYRLVHPILRWLRNHPLVIRRLFGIRIPKGQGVGGSVQFDPTTVLLARTLREILTAEHRRGLELGIGQGALVGLSVLRQARRQDYPFQLDGIDCSPSRVASSLAVAKFNDLAAEFWVSDLFSNVSPEAQYDLIFFNPPYVPTDVGNQLRFTERLEVDGDQVWDGGEDGTRVLAEFLNQSPRYLAPNGRVVFGVQNLFVPDSRVLTVVQRSGLRLDRRVRRSLIPSTVYIVGV